MVSRFLVTTALEETWPEDPETPVLFLGEWCRLYSRKERWSRMNAEVLPYHWDDRKKLYKDYLCLLDLYERLLPAVGEKLNQLHKVDHSVRYWRILIGPWLGYFIQMLFDRWTMLKRAFEEHDMSDWRVLEKNQSALIPKDMEDFIRHFLEDNWNEAIYSQLLREHLQSDITVEEIKVSNGQTNQLHQTNNQLEIWATKLKRSIANVRVKSKRWSKSSDEYFFISSSLSQLMEKKLQLRLGQKPQSWERIPVPQVAVDMKMRHWMIDKNDLFDKFSNIVNWMIPRHMPAAYLEGYKSLVDCIKKLPWPERPRCIFTCSAYIITKTNICYRSF